MHASWRFGGVRNLRINIQVYHYISRGKCMYNYKLLTSIIERELFEYYGVNESIMDKEHYTTTFRIFKTHVRHLVMMELIIQNYRSCNGGITHKLSGKSAIEHMIFKETKWHLDFIRTLSLQDILLVTAGQFNLDMLSDEDRFYLDTIINIDSIAEVDITGFKGWELGMGERYL